MIKIGFTGDFCPILRVEELLESKGWEASFATVVPFFSENNLNIIDLECPLTTANTTIRKTGPHLRARPESVGLLEAFNCRLVATANNHFKDYGSEGMRETYRVLRERGIDWVGSGLTPDETRKIATRKIGETRFAFINVAENEWSTLLEEGFGCNPLDLPDIYNDIQKAIGIADYVIVIAHGGDEHYELPSPRLKKWYRFFVDAGAHAVVGHHTHAISGYEIYKGSPIFYSLGNFCFDGGDMKNDSWNRGMIVRLLFEKKKPVSFEIKYVTQNDRDPGIRLVEGGEEQEMIQKVRELSEIILDDEKLTNAYRGYVSSLRSVTTSRIQPYTNRFVLSLHARGLLPSLVRTRKKRLLFNLIRCESHRDLLVESLKKDIG